MEPCFLSAAEAAARIRDRKLTSEALIRSCIERIEMRDAHVKGWLYFDKARTIATAREIDKRAPMGPLHGIRREGSNRQLRHADYDLGRSQLPRSQAILPHARHHRLVRPIGRRPRSCRIGLPSNRCRRGRRAASEFLARRPVPHALLE